MILERSMSPKDLLRIVLKGIFREAFQVQKHLSGEDPAHVRRSCVPYQLTARKCPQRSHPGTAGTPRRPRPPLVFLKVGWKCFFKTNQTKKTIRRYGKWAGTVAAGAGISISRATSRTRQMVQVSSAICCGLWSPGIRKGHARSPD